MEVATLTELTPESGQRQVENAEARMLAVNSHRATVAAMILSGQASTRAVSDSDALEACRLADVICTQMGLIAEGRDR